MMPATFAGFGEDALIENIIAEYNEVESINDDEMKLVILSPSIKQALDTVLLVFNTEHTCSIDQKANSH